MLDVNLKAHELALKFVERSNALQLRGKKRDDAALNFFVGASLGACLAGDLELGNHLSNLAVFTLSFRGYAGVELIIRSLSDVKRKEKEL